MPKPTYIDRDRNKITWVQMDATYCDRYGVPFAINGFMQMFQILCQNDLLKFRNELLQGKKSSQNIPLWDLYLLRTTPGTMISYWNPIFIVLFIIGDHPFSGAILPAELQFSLLGLI